MSCTAAVARLEAAGVPLSDRAGGAAIAVADLAVGMTCTQAGRAFRVTGARPVADGARAVTFAFVEDGRRVRRTVTLAASARLHLAGGAR